MGYCPNCGALTSDFAFCPRCGVKLDDFQASHLSLNKGERLTCCPQCGESSFASDFCPKCGARFNSESVGADRSTNPFEVGTNSSVKTVEVDDAPTIPGFFEAVMIGLNKTFDASGRASRSEFLYYSLFLFVSYIVVNFVEAKLLQNSDPFGVGIHALTFLIFWAGTLTATVRRFHDCNRSGGNYWFLPLGLLGFRAAYIGTLYVLGGLVALLYVFLLLLWKPTPGRNKYGPEPRRRE